MKRIIRDFGRSRPNFQLMVAAVEKALKFRFPPALTDDTDVDGYLTVSTLKQEDDEDLVTYFKRAQLALRAAGGTDVPRDSDTSMIASSAGSLPLIEQNAIRMVIRYFVDGLSDGGRD
ncbi:uncharacterized protein F4822DRAFT_113945 [Hypoxylon trugodes]|uniref:uncharacterized protein n=1 Tax=Hypoxylon trugodes TaxID=326681 RepID=UPI00219E3A9E|nr:uncharacterized protein F4822DRAFT_113945 [Hypoxylon trugodes]KAI1392033.1 hypothetical protein F4822DRAFT_113945 [Hypoxylon trugodes]